MGQRLHQPMAAHQQGRQPCRHRANGLVGGAGQTQKIISLLMTRTVMGNVWWFYNLLDCFTISLLPGFMVISGFYFLLQNMLWSTPLYTSKLLIPGYLFCFWPLLNHLIVLIMSHLVLLGLPGIQPHHLQTMTILFPFDNISFSIFCHIALARTSRTILNNKAIIILYCFSISYDMAFGLREIYYHIEKLLSLHGLLSFISREC